VVRKFFLPIGMKYLLFLSPLTYFVEVSTILTLLLVGVTFLESHGGPHLVITYF